MEIMLNILYDSLPGSVGSPLVNVQSDGQSLTLLSLPQMYLFVHAKMCTTQLQLCEYCSPSFVCAIEGR